MTHSQASLITGSGGFLDFHAMLKNNLQSLYFLMRAAFHSKFCFHKERDPEAEKLTCKHLCSTSLCCTLEPAAVTSSWLRNTKERTRGREPQS